MLRPPTLAVSRTAEGSSEGGEPYHILHFDGHRSIGTVTPSGSVGPMDLDTRATHAALAFEQDAGGQHMVSAQQFALTASQGRVPLVVLNTCRPGMLGEPAVNAAVATQLLESGVASVVAMGLPGP